MKLKVDLEGVRHQLERYQLKSMRKVFELRLEIPMAEPASVKIQMRQCQMRMLKLK